MLKQLDYSLSISMRPRQLSRDINPELITEVLKSQFLPCYILPEKFN